jgi:hypothetical protein
VGVGIEQLTDSKAISGLGLTEVGVHSHGWTLLSYCGATTTAAVVHTRDRTRSFLSFPSLNGEFTI